MTSTLTIFTELRRRAQNFWALWNTTTVKLWLDDVRPAPWGWYWAVNVEEAKDILESHKVTECSLDHDLGRCRSCEILESGVDPGFFACDCTCHKTGYDLVLWLAEMSEGLKDFSGGTYTWGYWPSEYTRVHSANPVGKGAMESVIKRYAPYTS